MKLLFPGKREVFQKFHANIKIFIRLTEIASVFLLICGLAKSCTYAVPVKIAHLCNRPLLFPQTFTPWSYFFWEGAKFFKTFMVKLKHQTPHWKCKCFCHNAARQNAALMLYQLTLHNCWTDHFHLLWKSLYASPRLQVFVLLNLWPNELLHLCC